MERGEKEEEVSVLVDQFRSSKVAVCAEYRGLTVAQMSSLRSALRSCGSVSRVVKNTLAKISVNKVLSDDNVAEKERFLELFKDPSFLIFGQEDAVASAKVVEKFSKDLDPFKVKGAWLDGKFLDKDLFASLSKLPSKEETLGQLLALINTPATQIVRVLNAPAQQLVQLLGAYKRKLEEQGS